MENVKSNVKAIFILLLIRYIDIKQKFYTVMW